MKKALIILFIFTALGCQSTGNKFAGLCQVEEQSDTFTNKMRVEFTNCWVAAGESVWDTPVYKFGFVWLEDQPDIIQVNLTYDSTVGGQSYTNFESIMINIDGNREVTKELSDTILDSSGYNNVSNTIYTSSRAAARIDMRVFENMMISNDVRIRINTSNGYSDYVFHLSENGMTKYAKYDLDKFVTAVNKYR